MINVRQELSANGSQIAERTVQRSGISGSASWGSSPCTPAMIMNGYRSPSPLVAWAVAPEWLTVAQAISLLGNGYTAEAVQELVDAGAVVAEEMGGAWMIERASLAEFVSALWELTDDEQ